MSARDADTLIERAIAAARRGDRGAARRHLMEALAHTPDHPRAARLLARLNEAKAAPAHRSRRGLWLLAGLGSASVVVLTGALLLLGQPAAANAMPTLLSVSSPTSQPPMALVEAASPQATPDAPQGASPTSATPLPRLPDATDLPLVDAGTPLASPTEITFVFALPTQTQPVALAAATDLPLPTQAAFVFQTTPPPGAAPITFAPFQPSPTPITFAPFQPSPTTTPSPTPAAATEPALPITPLPTLTSLPPMLIATDVPPPLFPTELPPTNAEFEMDPSGGGGR